MLCPGQPSPAACWAPLEDGGPISLQAWGFGPCSAVEEAEVTHVFQSVCCLHSGLFAPECGAGDKVASDAEREGGPDFAPA